MPQRPIYRDHKKNYKWVCVNEALKAGFFPDSLECANGRPIYKRVDPFDKDNYRPVSILLLWVYYHFYLKFKKEWYTSKRQIILDLFSMKFGVDLLDPKFSTVQSKFVGYILTTLSWLFQMDCFLPCFNNFKRLQLHCC